MDGCTISEAAQRTGFTPSALRFYEDHELVRPPRSAAGYRLYGEQDVERLRFIGRAKGFGLTLGEITELLQLRDGDACGPVQDRLRAMVSQKIAGAQDHVAELVAFTAELQRAARALDAPAPSGPCDDSCACTTGTLRADGSGPAAVALVDRRDRGAPRGGGADVPVACTLAPGQVSTRVADWQAALAHVAQREPLVDGVRLRFAPTADAGAIAGLAAAEQACCAFFTFHLEIGAAGLVLDVSGPPDARAVIDALFGVAA